MNEHIERVNQKLQEWEEIIELSFPEKETRMSEAEYSINRNAWNSLRESLYKDCKKLRSLHEQKKKEAVTILHGLIDLIEKTDKGFFEVEKKSDELLKRLNEKIEKSRQKHDNNYYLDKLPSPLPSENLCEAKEAFNVDVRQLDDKFNKWNLENTNNFDKVSDHMQSKKQYYTDEPDPVLPEKTQLPPSVSKEEKSRLPQSGSMNKTSPNELTPPTGYSPPGTDHATEMKVYLQYYNQPTTPHWYTSEQWAALQQQSKAQSLQWEQQYWQWQAHLYSEKYDQHIMKYDDVAGQVPPLPIKTQPPPPAEEDKSPMPSSGSVNACTYNTASSVSPSPLDENLSQEEKRFDEEFIPWDNKFSEWKLQHANHPDKEWYEIYKAKWTNWRMQLLEKRLQMRRRREALRLLNESAEAYPS